MNLSDTIHPVAIFGVPRSGTSWLGQIMNSSPNVAYRYQPLFSYAFKDYLDEQSSAEDIQHFHEELLTTEDEFVTQKYNISGKPTPTFKKSEITHLIWKEVRYLNLMSRLVQKSELKIIGIVRHPASVIYSWYNAPKEFDQTWNLSDEWIHAFKKNQGKPEEFYGFEKWKSATKELLTLKKIYQDRICIISYEDLNSNTLPLTEHVFKFCNLKVSDQTIDFINKSKSTSSEDPYDVFRKNKSNFEWKDLLDKKIVAEILSDPDFVKINNYFDW